MKLDMGRAWNEATALISSNKQVVTIVAGVFFFLPYLAVALLLPEATPPQVDPGDSEAALEAMTALYADYWWAFLLIAVAQGVGVLALFALLTDRARPTVSEALSRGVKGFLPYLAAQILMVLGFTLVLGIPLGLAGVSGMPAIIAVVGLVAIVAAIYAFIKLSLITPVIGIEQLYNPVAVLVRSWKLTKGNSLRLLAFYLLLFVVFIVISVLVTLVAGAIFAAFGGDLELIGNGIVGSLVNAVFVVLYLAVLAAVHRQLAGPSAEAVSETFE